MKIMICTIPIRPVPTDYPPFGAMAVIQSLREEGHDPVFFDIDGLRPSMSEILERFQEEKPDVLGISAVVSTAYGYVKELCLKLRTILPDLQIILGGNLAASPEILLRICSVDVCVAGDGEVIIKNLAAYYAQNHAEPDYSELEQIKGISYLDPNGEMVFTGVEQSTSAGDVLSPDFSILEEYSEIENFIADPLARQDFSQDSRSYEPHRAGKKMALVLFSKGCVARCTFCHRWEKGFRQLPPEKVIAQISSIMERYNVGFIQFGDENFGSDRKATEELLRLIKPLDILWQVSGVRAGSVDLELLKRMRDAGCVALYYGFETGSPDILKVMEKKLELSHSLDTARAMHQAGLFTIYQLVLGMPGESPRTISETIEMVKNVTEFLPLNPFHYLSINYIQALPGTPVYEYARSTGRIGSQLEDEEKYLLSISDVNAHDDSKFINYTSYPYLVVRSWRLRIRFAAMTHWAKMNRSRDRVDMGRAITHEGNKNLAYEKGGYFNLAGMRIPLVVLRFLEPIEWLPVWAWTIATEYWRSPTKVFFSRLWELIVAKFKKIDETSVDYISLRKTMRTLAAAPTTKTEESMVPFRLGR